MIPAEHKIIKTDSAFYIHTPSITAKATFFYPLRTGFYHYETGYFQERRRFDSFLLMYIEHGSMSLQVSSGEYLAQEGQFVLLDCYQYHAYTALEDSRVLWLHFDGLLARPHWAIITKAGPVISIQDPTACHRRLGQIYQMFSMHESISEVVISKYITDILTECILSTQNIKSDAKQQAQVIEDSMAYITDNLDKKLTITDLAAHACMSNYYFIHAFKDQTGYTPHAYMVNSRIHTAQYWLVNSSYSLKQIAQKCGFTDTSAFCAAFKKRTGTTPIQYRKNHTQG